MVSGSADVHVDVRMLSTLPLSIPQTST